MGAITKKLKEKRASGSVYLGLVLMLVAFVAVLVCVNLFQLYGIHTRAQLISDTIADGAAIAGCVNLTFDESIAKETAEQIFQANISENTNGSYTIEVNEELDSWGQSTGYYIVKTTCTISAQSYGHSFFLSSLGNDSSHKSSYTATASSTVRCKLAVTSNSYLKKSYYYEKDAYLDFATTTSKNRTGAYVSWLIKFYLSPEYNPIYLSNDSAFNSMCFLIDYYKCMGFETEYFAFDSIKELHQRTKTFGIGNDATIHNTATSLQMAADEGKPTVILCRDKQNPEIYEFYVVVPQNNTLLPNQIVVAHANGYNQNYQIIDWNDFCSNHIEIYAYSQE